MFLESIKKNRIKYFLEIINNVYTVFDNYFKKSYKNYIFLNYYEF